jgi:NTE family protein
MRLRFVKVMAAAAASALLASCATLHNLPSNLPISSASANPLTGGGGGVEAPNYTDDLLIGLTFSGGGMRAAAFSFGVLKELDTAQLPRTNTAVPLTDRIDFVSGVSGGSVTAAYFGLKKREGLADFRERFLLRDAEAGMITHIGPATVAAGFSGGLNTDQFPRWLDANLFDGATFAELRADRRPRVWINASDIYNRTPFVFGRTAFDAICSNLSTYKLSNAVAASAAVPLVFAPIVLETYGAQCPTPLPGWATKAIANPNAPPMLRAFSLALNSYRSGSVKYIKLLDGGLVDNFGVSGFTIARETSDTPYGPLTPQQAVKIRRAMFMVVDSGRAPSGDWVKTIEGPGGVELIGAASDTAIDASVRASYTAFERTQFDWLSQIIRWRCGLSAADRKKLGAGPKWNCRDVKFFVGRVSFDQLGPERAGRLNTVPTRFKLPAESVDLLIQAGQDALRNNATYRSFLSSL